MDDNKTNIFKPLIVFGVSKPNIYSYAKIIGILEQYPEILNKFDIKIFKKNILSREFFNKFYAKIAKGGNIESLRKRILIIFPISILTSQMEDFYNFFLPNLNLLKENIGNDRILTIAGGWHAIGCSKQLLKDGIDLAIVGEGEKIFPTILIYILGLLEKYKKKGFVLGNRTIPMDISIISSLKEILEEKINEKSINFIAFTRKLKLKENEIKLKENEKGKVAVKYIVRRDVSKKELINLDEICPYSEKFRIFSPIEISRGCPFRCKFCQTGNFYNSMRHASIDVIIKWIKHAVKIKYNRVWFLSPNSFAYGSKNGMGTAPQKVETLLRSIKEIKNLKEIFFGTFPSEIRPEFVTYEMMDAVAPYISNKYFSIGAQTASNSLLKKILRSHTFEDVENAIDIILDYGFGVDLDFIFGLPGETEEDKQLTIQFFKNILNSSKKVRIHTHTFIPLPGTPFQNKTAGKLSAELESIIGKLALRGKAFGQYKKQSEMINKIK
ncbi:MAG: TIGR04013 family B12-binding domain/radical SAM domain-containing protein [Promethearchaeota archaeon]